MAEFEPKLRFQPGPTRKLSKDQLIERFEQKYIIHPALVPEIREFIRPFCIADPNGKGEVPEYIVTTLQLDTPTLALVLAKERKAFTRFKLRIRSYGIEEDPGCPVFLEIKRKIGGVVVKSRAKMSLGDYTPEIFTSPSAIPRLSTPKDDSNMMEFLRLQRRLNAKPRILIRYIRESYFGANDDYARVTFDRRICYRTTRDWRLPRSEHSDFNEWRVLDTQTGLGKPYAGYVFELKAMRDAPSWMMELVERFSLTAQGYSKYAAAHRMESLYDLSQYSTTGKNVTQEYGTIF